MQFCFNAKKSNVKRNLPCMITHWLEWGDWLQFCHFILFYMALEMQETLRYCYFDDINRPPFYTIFNLAENWLVFKVCIIRLVHIVLKKSSSTFWPVHCCAHRTRRSCQKYYEDFFKFCGLLRKPKLYKTYW